jgi:hypothetical protein
MQQCPVCRRTFSADARYCSYCGKPLVDHEIKSHSEETPIKPRKQEREKPCPFCHSTGKIDIPMRGEINLVCPVCKGRRYNFIPEDYRECIECSGTGEFTYGTGIGYTRKPCPE